MHTLRRLPLKAVRGISSSAHPLPRSTLDLYLDRDVPVLDEAQLNEELQELVNLGRFSPAERLRLKISANGLCVHPRPEYARVALACLRNRPLSGGKGHKLDEYVTWLNLISGRELLRDSTSLPPPSPFDQLVHEITYRAAVPKFRPFLSQTGLVIASKGFAERHFLNLARPIIIHSLPTSPCLSALIEMEQRAASYEQLYQRPPTPIAAHIRGSLIQLFAQRGWVWKSIDLILMRRTYTLPDAMYQMVMDGIHNTRQVHKKDQILKRWEKDRLRRLHGINK